MLIRARELSKSTVLLSSPKPLKSNHNKVLPESKKVF
jgi:hypothetical protein